MTTTTELVKRLEALETLVVKHLAQVRLDRWSSYQSLAYNEEYLLSILPEFENDVRQELAALLKAEG